MIFGEIFEILNFLIFYFLVCPAGTYVSNGNCTTCPTGSTTSGTTTATIAGCNVCTPGYGYNAVDGTCTGTC